MIPDILIEDFDYDLPDERIAKYPLKERDSSKLLLYKDGKIDDYVFRDLPSLLPAESIMVFNDTRVVPARLHFVRPTGAHIEIFCLEPVDPVEYNLSFASTGSCSWKCIIGNAKRWKGESLFFAAPEDDPEASALKLRADSDGEREGQTMVVRFSWEGGMPFSRVLEICGNVPIPPYLNRDTEPIDLERYQTLYAKIRGSVAAPTAGLHFTDAVLDAIKAKGIDVEEVCLHVGAGTFLPVKSTSISGHPMHREPFSVSLNFLKTILEGEKNIIAVGTTSVRTLESLYYAGVDIIRNGEPHDVEQWAPYEQEYPYTTEEALEAIVRFLESRGLDSLRLGTRIIIVPGFRFRLVDMLVTNFHQPQSTLLLLISAFVRGDWKTIYDHASASGYRFLSYGDSSLLNRVD